MTTPVLLPSLASAGESRKTIETLLADSHRKLVSIRLREGGVMAAHKAIWPITIHCTEGSGELLVGERVFPLLPGMIVPLDPHVVHEVVGKPDLAILVTMFRDPAQGKT